MQEAQRDTNPTLYTFKDSLQRKNFAREIVGQICYAQRCLQNLVNAAVRHERPELDD